MKVINVTGHNIPVGHTYARRCKTWIGLNGFLLELVQTPPVSGKQKCKHSSFMIALPYLMLEMALLAILLHISFVDWVTSGSALVYLASDVR